MLLNVCIAKLHRATVTDADLNYIGSITIDEALLEAAGLREGQMVQITNASNAVLWRTYILKGERGKGQIVLNGPPARLFQKGDKVVILGEAWVTPEEADSMKGPTVVFFTETGANPNEIKEVKKVERPA
jgi:aspartate 1-decarboxylase